MTRPLSPAALQRLADRIADPMPARKELSRGAQIRAVIFGVADSYGLTVDDLKGPSRQSLIVLARHEAFWRLRHEFALSYPAIGQLMGGKDHSTVIYGVREHEKTTARLAERVRRSGHGILLIEVSK